MARADDLAWDGTQRVGEWQIVRRLRETRAGTHWQTADGFLLVELGPEIAAIPAKSCEFMHMAETFAALSHPRIARVLDWMIAGDTSYVVFDAPRGATIRELEQRLPVPSDITARIALDALDAVEYAHEIGTVFGDLDADSIIVTKRGHLVVLPTCNSSGAASMEDDIKAVGQMARISHAPRTARGLGNWLRALDAIADREKVGRFVSRALLTNSSAAPRSMPSQRLRELPVTYEDVTPVLPIALSRARQAHELSPEDLIPIEASEPEIPIYVYIEEPPDPGNTERPVVCEPDIMDAQPGPAAKARRAPVMLITTLCVACGLMGHVLWRGASTLSPAAAVGEPRAPRPASAVVEAQLTSAVPTTAVSAAALESADAATAQDAPAMPRAATPRRARRPAAQSEPPSSDMDVPGARLESNPYQLLPSEP